MLVPVLTASATKEVLITWNEKQQPVRERLCDLWISCQPAKPLLNTLRLSTCNHLLDIVESIVALVDLSLKPNHEVVEFSPMFFRSYKQNFKPVNRICNAKEDSGEWEETACINFLRAPVMDLKGELLAPIVTSMDTKLRADMQPLVDGFKAYFKSDKVERFLLDSLSDEAVGVLSKGMQADLFTACTVSADGFGARILANQISWMHRLCKTVQPLVVLHQLVQKIKGPDVRPADRRMSKDVVSAIKNLRLSSHDFAVFVKGHPALFSPLDDPLHCDVLHNIVNDANLAFDIEHESKAVQGFLSSTWSQALEESAIMIDKACPKWSLFREQNKHKTKIKIKQNKHKNKNNK